MPHSQVRGHRFQIRLVPPGLHQPARLEAIAVRLLIFPEADAFQNHMSDRLDPGAHRGEATAPIRLQIGQGMVPRVRIVRFVEELEQLPVVEGTQFQLDVAKFLHRSGITISSRLIAPNVTPPSPGFPPPSPTATSVTERPGSALLRDERAKAVWAAWGAANQYKTHGLNLQN